MPPTSSLLPRVLLEQVAAFGRDARQVYRGWAGTRPPPFTIKPRKASPKARLEGALATRDARIRRVIRETKDCVSLELEDVRGDGFVFEPGQFLTLALWIDGEQYRRAYSVSSMPDEGGRAKFVTVTAKRVAGGVVSNYVNDRLAEGDVLQVLGPSGNFTVPAHDGSARHLVLLGGGSGITPLVSMARTLLATEPTAHISLVYGNRGKEDIIFHDALAELARDHAGRFHLRHVLAEAPAAWAGGVGMLTREVVARELDALEAPSGLATSYFICGPEAMMAEARAALLARGVAEGNIHEERFAQPHRRTKEAKEAAPGAASIRTRGKEVHVIVGPQQTLLEAGLEAGAPMPYSCAMGGCGACRVKVVEGSVVMEEPNCLTDEERKGGFALACIGRPQGKVVVEV